MSRDIIFDEFLSNFKWFETEISLKLGDKGWMIPAVTYDSHGEPYIDDVIYFEVVIHPIYKVPCLREFGTNEYFSLIQFYDWEFCEYDEYHKPYEEAN